MLLMASNILHVSLLQVFASLIHAETPRGLGRHSSVDLPSMPRHAKTLVSPYLLHVSLFVLILSYYL